MTQLEQLSRTALQKKAKEAGVAATGTSAAIVARLAEYLAGLPTFEDWFAHEEDLLLREAIQATEIDEEEEEEEEVDTGYGAENWSDEDSDDIDSDGEDARALARELAVIALADSLDALEDATWRAYARTSTASPSSPGIFYFALAVLALFNAGAVFGLDIDAATAVFFLGPMFVADPIAAIVGRLAPRVSWSIDSILAIPAPQKRAPLAMLHSARKTLSGALGFAVACALWIKYAPVYVLALPAGGNAAALAAAPLLQIAAVAASLAALELIASELDNIMLPLVFAAIVAPSAAPQLVVAALAPLAASSVARTALAAYWQFARPHTIIGTSLSITVVSSLALRTTPDRFPPSAAAGLVIALVAALHANVYIVGLNQMFDVDIDRTNKPYLPVASGEYTAAFGWALVVVHGAAAVLTAKAFGSAALVATVGGSMVLGTLYSVPFGKCLRCSAGAHDGRWKGIPILAAACIFVVRRLCFVFASAQRVSTHERALSVMLVSAALSCARRARVRAVCRLVVRTHPPFSFSRSCPTGVPTIQSMRSPVNSPQVRGLIVQIGFHEHARASVAGNDHITVAEWRSDSLTLFSITFFTIVGVAIALMKVRFFISFVCSNLFFCLLISLFCSVVRS